MKSAAGPMFSLVFLPSILSAFEYPRPFIDDYQLPEFEANRILQDVTTVYHYGDDPDFDPDALDSLVSSGWLRDSISQTLTRTERTVSTPVVDASNRLVQLEARTLPVGSPFDYRIQTTWNPAGKPILDVITNLADSTILDSTTYIWNHPDCPDLLLSGSDGSLEKITWSVDDLGRCASGVDSVREAPLDPWTFSRRIQRSWSVDGPIEEVALDENGDTLGLFRLRYDGVGKPVADSTWISGDSGLWLDETCSNTLVDGALKERICSSRDGFYATISTLRLETPTGISGFPPRAPSLVETAASSDQMRFRNTSALPLEIRIRSLTGTSLGTVRLAPGSQALVPHPGGTVVWVAKSSTSSSSGILTAIR